MVKSRSRIFVKYDGKGASECADCELRGVALTNLNFFYPVAERAAVAALPIPLDGIGRGAAGIRRAYMATQNQHNEKVGGKIPIG